MSHRFAVEPAHVLMFSRSIGEPDPPLDSPAPVPPTFVMAAAHFDPDYHLRPRPGEPWVGSSGVPSQRAARLGPGAGDEPKDEPGAAPVLHAEQRFEYHAPVRIGAVLNFSTRPGERWVKDGRSGRLEFGELVTELRDEMGRLVVTATTVTVRATPAKGADR